MFESAACNVHASARALWYSFTPSETAYYTAVIPDSGRSSEEVFAGGTFSAILSVFSGGCEGISCLGSEEACFVRGIGGLVVYCDQTVSFLGRAGTTYHIVVSGKYGFEEAGFFRLNLVVSEYLFCEDGEAEKVGCFLSTLTIELPGPLTARQTCAFTSDSKTDCYTN